MPFSKNSAGFWEAIKTPKGFQENLYPSGLSTASGEGNTPQILENVFNLAPLSLISY